MKFVLLILALEASGLTLLACMQQGTEREQLIRKNAEPSIRKRLGTTADYGFVSLTVLDSVRYRDNLQTIRQTLERELASQQARLNSARTDTAGFATLKQTIDRTRVALQEVGAAADSLGELANAVAAYRYTFTYRTSNAFGSPIIDTYLVEVGPAPDYPLLNLAKTADQRLSAPNAFPGYEAIRQKNHPAIY